MPRDWFPNQQADSSSRFSAVDDWGYGCRNDHVPQIRALDLRQEIKSGVPDQQSRSPTHLPQEFCGDVKSVDKRMPCVPWSITAPAA